MRPVMAAPTRAGAAGGGGAAIATEGAQRASTWSEYLAALWRSNSAQLCVLSAGVAYALTWASDSALLNAPVALAATVAAARLVSRADKAEEQRAAAAALVQRAEKGLVAAGDGAGPGAAGGNATTAAWQERLDPVEAEEIEALVRAVVDEFIRKLWWEQWMPDRAFPRETERLLGAIIAEVVVRAREVNMAALLLRDAVAVAGAQLESFRQARDVALGPADSATAGRLGHAERSRRIARALAAGGSLHVASRSKRAEHAYFAHISDAMVTRVLPAQEGSVRVLRLLSRELLATTVLTPVLGACTPAAFTSLLANVIASRKEAGKAGVPGESGAGYGSAAARSAGPSRARPGRHRRTESDPAFLRRQDAEQMDLGTMSLSAVLGDAEADDRLSARSAVGEAAQPAGSSEAGAPRSPSKRTHTRVGSNADVDALVAQSLPDLSREGSATDRRSSKAMSSSVPSLPAEGVLEAEYVVVDEDDDPLRGSGVGVGGTESPQSASGGGDASAASQAASPSGGQDGGDVSSSHSAPDECEGEPLAALTEADLRDAFVRSHVSVSITSSVMREETGVRMLQKPEYVAYILTVAAEGASWTVERRFRQFEALHKRMRDVPAYEGMELPPKRRIPGLGNTGKAIIGARRYLLEAYLVELVSSPRLKVHPAVAEFLLPGTSYDPSGDGRALAAAVVGGGAGLSGAAGGAGASSRRTRAHSAATAAQPSASQPVLDGRGSLGDRDRFARSDSVNSRLSGTPEHESELSTAESGAATATARSTRPPIAAPLSTPAQSFTAGGRGTRREQDGRLVQRAASTRPTHGEPPDEAAMVVSASRQLDHLFGLSEGLYEFASIVFNLRERGWLRRQVVWIAKQLVEVVAGEAMEDALSSGMDALASAGTRAYLVKLIRETVWPGGVWYTLVPSYKERLEENTFAAEMVVRKALLDDPQVPDALVNLIGKKSCRAGLRDIHQAISSEAFTRQFSLSLFEVLLCHLFPELELVVDAAKDEAADVLRAEQAEERRAAATASVDADAQRARD